MQKKWIVVVLLTGIIVGGIFVRTYNFEDWLYFKMDQARDAMLIANALENGPAYLPLLGPRAGATEVDSGYLRLGPAYYYMQYFAGILSEDNLPMSNAYPDLFFSIAILPLLYIFLRLYFSRFNSLLVTAMYTFSFLVVQYSRFSWNPNPLPFFFILSFYGLLRFFREDDFNKKLWWIALWSFGLAVGAQLHFFGFFSLLGVSGLMLLWYWGIWKKENWQKFFLKTKMKSLVIFGVVALGVFMFVSAPIIISDFYREGENSKNFIQAIGSKPEKKPLINKIEKNVSESFKYYCLLGTSACATGDGFDKKNILPATIVVMLMFVGLGYALIRLVKMKEINEGKRDFLFLVLAWTAVFFILSIPVAYQIRPRFFIVVFAIPFILFAFIFKWMQEKFGKRGILLSLIFAFLVITVNVRGTAKWFDEQRDSQTKDVAIARTLILKAKDGVTLGQLQRAVDFMYDRRMQGAKIYYYVKPEHVAPVKFLLSQKNDSDLQIGTLGKEVEEGSQIFAITTTGDGMQAFEKKFGSDFSVSAQEKVGQITVSEVQLQGLKIKKAEMFFNRNKGKSDRVFWKDVFNLEEKAGAMEIEGLE